MIKDSLRLVRGDLSARTNVRLDYNKAACAIIKVYANDDIITVDGPVIGEVVKRSVWERWIYVCPGTKEVKITFVNHRPLSVRFPAVEKGAVYELNLVDPAAAAQQPARQDPGSQYLVLTVSPANAFVKVDGNAIEVTGDGTAMVNLPYGAHTYSVAAPGYREESGSVTIGKERQTVSVALVSEKATLTVTCPTAGADIYVNNVRRGSAPGQASSPQAPTAWREGSTDTTG